MSKPETGRQAHRPPWGAGGAGRERESQPRTSNGNLGSGAPPRRWVPVAASVLGRGSLLPNLRKGLVTVAGIPGGSPGVILELSCSVARWALRAPREGRGSGRRGRGEGERRGGTHVDRQRPRVDGGLGPHGRLEPQLQLLPHVGARDRRTMLVKRLGEGRGAAGGDGAGGRWRAGG